MAKQSLLFTLVVFFFAFAGVASCSSSDPTAADPSAAAQPAEPGDDDGSVSDGGPKTDGGKKTDAGSCATTCKGCCDGETCIATPTATKCGTFGKACNNCSTSSDGHSCMGALCGCRTQAECPSGTVCDPDSSLCEKACSASSPCASGCCGANGLCAKGTDTKTCGASGTCLDCSFDAKGKACVGGGCGCNVSADCPGGSACDVSTHACTTACSATQVCNGACCSNGTCSNAANVCASDPKGNTCVGSKGACGCYDATECPQGMACDTKTNTCTSTCSATQQCNGGCCNGSTCDLGTTDAVCGGAAKGYVATCISCPGSKIGGHCRSGGFGYTCGACTTQAECNAPAICNGTTCCLPKGAAATANPRDCCSDVISSGFCL